MTAMYDPTTFTFRPARTTNVYERLDFTPRSKTMHVLHEALARERLRELQQHSHESRQVSALRSERRYSRALLRRGRHTVR